MVVSTRVSPSTEVSRTMRAPSTSPEAARNSARCSREAGPSPEPCSVRNAVCASAMEVRTSPPNAGAPGTAG
ncbi:hypothetical protein ACFQXA_10525 [Nocardiopsis composta]